MRIHGEESGEQYFGVCRVGCGRGRVLKGREKDEEAKRSQENPYQNPAKKARIYASPTSRERIT